MKKIEYYTVKPNLKQFFGRKVNKGLKFDEWTEDKKVHQILDKLVLTTEIHDKREIKMIVNGKEEVITQDEVSTIKQNLKTGVILIWDEEQGYIIPSCQMCTLNDIEDDIKAMKEVYEVGSDDTKRNENKGV